MLVCGVCVCVPNALAVNCVTGRTECPVRVSQAERVELQSASRTRKGSPKFTPATHGTYPVKRKPLVWIGDFKGEMGSPTEPDSEAWWLHPLRAPSGGRGWAKLGVSKFRGVPQKDVVLAQSLATNLSKGTQNRGSTFFLETNLSKGALNNAPWELGLGRDDHQNKKKWQSTKTFSHQKNTFLAIKKKLPTISLCCLYILFFWLAFDFLVP